MTVEDESVQDIPDEARLVCEDFPLLRELDDLVHRSLTDFLDRVFVEQIIGVRPERDQIRSLPFRIELPSKVKNDMDVRIPVERLDKIPMLLPTLDEDLKFLIRLILE